jgi:dTMP kinase
MGLYTSVGVFVCFEGGDGSGKSTQSRVLAEWLEAEGYVVRLTFEPGDTEVGRICATSCSTRRRGAVRPHRVPAVRRRQGRARHASCSRRSTAGEVVITDRYVDSMLAYQGAGRPLELAEVEHVARWATHDLRPHLTVVLDLEPDHGWAASTSATGSRASRWSSTSGSAGPSSTGRPRPRALPRPRRRLPVDVVAAAVQAASSPSSARPRRR